MSCRLDCRQPCAAAVKTSLAEIVADGVDERPRTRPLNSKLVCGYNADAQNFRSTYAGYGLQTVREPAKHVLTLDS